MKSRKQHRWALHVGIILFLIWGIVSCGGEQDTAIDMNRSVPPTFTLSGNGELGWIAFTDLSPSDISVYAPERVIWKITPTGENTPWRLPKITYGVVPPGFAQEIPANGAPPSLVDEKPYAVSAQTSSANTGSLIFLIRGGQSWKVLQTPNGEYHLENSEVFRSAIDQ